MEESQSVILDGINPKLRQHGVTGGSVAPNRRVFHKLIPHDLPMRD